MADQEDQHAGQPESSKTKKTKDLEAFYSVLLTFKAEGLIMGNNRARLMKKLMTELNIAQETSMFFDNDIQKKLQERAIAHRSDDAKLTNQLEDLKRKAFYYVLLAFRAETLTIGNKTQIIEELMNEWDITQETRISFEDTIQKGVDSEEDHDDKARDDELDKLTQLTTKTEALGLLLNAYKDVTSTMDEKARVIQELTDHWKETKAIIPPNVINPVRQRKGVDKFSEIDHRSFLCICGQRFSQQSNLTTHKKRCTDAERQRIFKAFPKKMRTVHNILSAPSDGSDTRQSKFRSAYNITEKSLPSRAASSSSDQRRAIDSVLAAFKGESSTISEERDVLIENLRQAWCMTRHGLSTKTREDAERQVRAQIDLSDLQREQIISMVGPAIALQKLKQASLPPHVAAVDDEEEEVEEEA